jgi:hypothetical protein
LILAIDLAFASSSPRKRSSYAFSQEKVSVPEYASVWVGRAVRPYFWQCVWAAWIAGPGLVPYHCATPPISVPSTVGAHAVNPNAIAIAPKRIIFARPFLRDSLVEHRRAGQPLIVRVLARGIVGQMLLHGRRVPHHQGL